MNNALAVPDNASSIQDLHTLIKDVCSKGEQVGVRSKVSVEHDDSGRVWYTAWVLHGNYSNVFTGTWLCIAGSSSLAGLRKLVENR